MRGEGRGRAFKKKSLKVALQHVHDHVARHMGAGFDLREASPSLTDPAQRYGMVQGFEHGAANGTASTGVLKPRAERCGTQERLVPL